MSCACLPCFQSNVESQPNDEIPVAQARDTTISTPPPAVHIEKQAPLADAGKEAEAQTAENGDDTAKSFTFRELATATKNFRQECLLGEGGFGRVFRGTLQSSGQIVAVRQLDRSGTQGSKEFQAEVLMLSLLHHPNLVPLIGYCADGDQRLLVYEYMPSGSLKSHLFDLPPNKKPLNWSARMKIASGIAQGLEYLHEKANPPIIYRDLKSSNILLDEINNPRLSEYGLAKLLQSGNKMHVSPRVMAGYGYCAPEYERCGDLTSKSDVYSFGVVLLELITGRKALDTARPTEEQNIVSWAQPIFRDPSRFPDMADPLLRKEFSTTSLNQAVGVASMCLQEEPSVRPLISDVVAAIGFLATAPPEAPVPARLVSILSSRVDISSQHGFKHSIKEGNFSSGKEEYSSESSDSEDEGQKNSLEEHKDTDEQDDSGSSASSDDEDMRDKSQRKFKESSKWGSSSNGKSKVRSQSKHSGTSSRKTSVNSRSSSIYSRDSSMGFSLRCDSSIPEHSIPSNSRKDTVQESHDSDAGSSSDEESWNNTSHDRKDSTNSRSNTSTNKSMSSKKRQESFAKSASSYSRNSSNASSEGGDVISPKQHDNMESSMRSNSRTESGYSRHSSIVDSEDGDDE